jgi:hypothetical protein
MTAAHSATPSFTPANVIFTTAATYTQAQVKAKGTGATATDQMISGADAICTAGGWTLFPSPSPSPLPGSWHAMLGAGNSTSAAYSRLVATNPNPRGWVRPDGNVFGDSLNGIFAGGYINYPPRITETKASLGATENSWTGCDYTGFEANVNNCGDWTDTSTNGFSAGIAAAGTMAWLEGNLIVNIGTSPLRCNGSFHVLCMQSDYHAVVAVPTPPAGSRRIFVSDATLTPTANGINDFDTYCTNSGPGGTFKALVATSAATAASHFNAPRGVPIVRMDGVVVSATDAAFFGGGATAAEINVTQSFSYLGWQIFTPFPWVFTGSSAVNVLGGTGNTCYNGSTSWTSTGGNATGGLAFEPNYWFDADPLGGQSASCSGARVYCLEQ